MRLIDADALKRKAQRAATESWKMRVTARIETVLNQFIDWIDNAPSIQPERKTGLWIPCPQNASWLYVYKCSECGGYLQISDVDGKGYKANYCSYCGAKMEGGEAE